MSRINSNIPSLVAQSNLSKTGSELNLRLERLSTGVRINRGSDDPAGLIISNRLRTEIKGIEQGIKNGQRASSVIATTESALAEVSDLLNSIKSLLVESANTGANSAEERAANQLQIDSAIDSITRISNTASFGGLNLLDGSLDYVVSGVDAGAISNATINGAAFVDSPQVNVEIDTIASAQRAGLFLNGDNATGTDGVLQSSTTLEIKGSKGTTELQFQAGTPLSAVVTAVNSVGAITGVQARLLNPANHLSGMVFQSSGYGSDEFVSVNRVQGEDQNPAVSSFQLFKFTDGTALPGGVPWGNPNLTAANRDTGQDVAAIINGVLANGTGLQVSVSSSTLSGTFLLEEAFATDPSRNPTTFDITGGGALFQLGPDITVQQQINLGVPSVSASTLGGTLVNGSLTFLSSLKDGQSNSIKDIINAQSGDFSTANDVLNMAIDQVSLLRGRLGATERNVLQTNERSLQSAFENLSASESQIRDADFAYETSMLTRAQTLSSAGTTILALANSQSQTVLQLLG